MRHLFHVVGQDQDPVIIMKLVSAVDVATNSQLPPLTSVSCYFLEWYTLWCRILRFLLYVNLLQHSPSSASLAFLMIACCLVPIWILASPFYYKTYVDIRPVHFIRILLILLLSWIIFVLSLIFRLDALALSVIATATWLAGWLGGCHTPVLYQNG